MSELREEPLDAVLRRGTTELAIASLRLQEKASVPTRADVELRRVDGLDGSWLDHDVEVVLRRGVAPARMWALRVAEVRFGGRRDGMFSFQMRLHSSLHFLSLGEGTRKLRDCTPKDAVSQVLEAAGLPHRWALGRALRPRPFIVQYRESDHDFVHRLLAEEGVGHWHEDDGTLVLTDQWPSREVVGPDALDLVTGGGALAHGREALLDLARGRRVGPGRVTVSDYDWKRPAQVLRSSDSDTRDAELEIYDFPTGYRDEAHGNELARVRREAATCRKSFLRTRTTFVAFGPGGKFETNDGSRVEASGQWTIVEVAHEYAQASASEPARYHNDAESIPASVGFRPPLPQRVSVGGVHTATVVGPPGEEIHTDDKGRCKVKWFWDREALGTDADSRWLRVVQEISSSHVLARVGWEVVVTYVDGDPARPMALCRLINGAMVPSYGQPDHQNMLTIKSETYPKKEGFNELRIDDTAGAQKIYVRAERDLAHEVKNDQREMVGRDERHQVGDGLTRRVLRDQRMEIGRHDDSHVGARDAVKVKGKARESIGKNESVRVDEGVAETVTGRDRETVGASRISIVGGVRPPPPPKIDKPALPGAKDLGQAAISGGPQAVAASLKSALPTPSALKSKLTPPSLESLLQGGISRSARRLLTRTMGAVHLAIAKATVTHSAGKVLLETVGGLRLATSIKEGIQRSSAGAAARFVGGVLVEQAGTRVSRSADSATTTVGGIASMNAEKKVELRGKTISIEATTGLSFSCGDLAIEMTPEKLTLKGDLRVITGTRVVVGGSPDNVTK